MVQLLKSLLTINRNKSFNNSIEYSRLNLQVKIYSVQLENAFIIYETPPPPWHDLNICPPI